MLPALLCVFPTLSLSPALPKWRLWPRLWEESESHYPTTLLSPLCAVAPFHLTLLLKAPSLQWFVLREASCCAQVWCSGAMQHPVHHLIPLPAYGGHKKGDLRGSPKVTRHCLGRKRCQWPDLQRRTTATSTHIDTSGARQLHPLLPFLQARLKRRRRRATAAAKQQITGGLLIPRRASQRSAQLESLHLNR